MSPTQDRSLRPGELIEAEKTRGERRTRLSLLLKVAAALGLVWLLGQLAAVLWPRSLSDLGGRTSYSYKADGYRGCLELVRALGRRAEVKRSSYGQLPAPETGVLVMIDPLPSTELELGHGQKTDPGQVHTLELWLATGGRILASAPARTMHRVSAFGLEMELDPESDQEPQGSTVLDDVLADGLPRTEWIEVHGELAWEEAMGGTSERWSFPEGHAARLAAAFLSTEPETFRFPLDRDSAPPKLQVFAEPVPPSCEIVARLDGRPFVLLQRQELLQPQKQGLAWLVASAWPFCNLALARHGTARFTTRLCALAQENGGRTLYFDEYGHGLWERRGWLFWLHRDVLLYPALGLAALALLFLWRGSQRFGAPADEPPRARRAKEEFVLGLADVALRAGRHGAAARSLLATYQARLGEHGLDRDSEPDWARLDASVSSSARFGRAELQKLAREADALYQRQLTNAGLARPGVPRDSSARGPGLREHAPSSI